MGDTSKHLTYFKVENFKRFESFEMNDLGQFNLILGDNNTGKTSALEALLVDELGQETFSNFLTALSYRNLFTNFKLKDIDQFANRTRSLNQAIIFISFDLRADSERRVSIEVNSVDQKVTVKKSLDDFQQFSFHHGTGMSRSLPFIPFYKGHDRDLTNYYSDIIQKNRSLKRKLEVAMKLMIPDFENLELSAPYTDQYPHLIVSERGKDATLPLAMFGDGTIKLFRFLVEIIANRGRRLMIDEIDTGIHFSRFKAFWKTILTTAKDNDVQLFMTTHNEECIKYFVDSFNEPELKEHKSGARNISLMELPNGSVKAYTYSYEQLEANVHLGNEVRGGAR